MKFNSKKNQPGDPPSLPSRCPWSLQCFTIDIFTLKREVSKIPGKMITLWENEKQIHNCHEM